jgi:hypothetical protein
VLLTPYLGGQLDHVFVDWLEFPLRRGIDHTAVLTEIEGGESYRVVVPVLISTTNPAAQVPGSTTLLAAFLGLASTFQSC